MKVKHFDITRSMEIIDFMKFNENKKKINYLGKLEKCKKRK